MGIILYTMVPLLNKKLQKWRLTCFAIKLFNLFIVMIYTVVFAPHFRLLSRRPLSMTFTLSMEPRWCPLLATPCLSSTSRGWLQSICSAGHRRPSLTCPTCFRAGCTEGTGSSLWSLWLLVSRLCSKRATVLTVKIIVAVLFSWSL